MKKILLFTLCILCLNLNTAFATHDSNCNKQPSTISECPKPCPQTYKEANRTDCFLCSGKTLHELTKCMNLSEAQLCNAYKLQEKYEQEVYSLNERICCEEKTLAKLEATCSKWSDRHKQKSLIKKLNRDKKKICKCYEDQFKTTLSADQIREYNRAKK